jgi:DNA/RNA endonuclease YhcR with UshA esterase domain
MKFLAAVFVLAWALPSAAQNGSGTVVPKYDIAKESTYRGTIAQMRDRRCPVSGGMGAHVVLQMENGSAIEVHLATTEFTKMVELSLHPGDRIEVTGFRTEFEGVPTIFARVIKHGVDEFMFRDKNGSPIW